MKLLPTTPIQKLLILLFAASCLTMRAGGPVEPRTEILSDCVEGVELMYKFDLNFQILYLGPSDDTIFIPCGSLPVGEDRKVEKSDYNGSWWNKETISIFIDTTQPISTQNYHYRKNPEIVLETVIGKSYPVLVLNTSGERNDFIGTFPLHLEYLDSSGTWQMAQNNDFRTCNDLSRITRFEAGEMIIGRLPVFGAGKMYRLRISIGFGENAVHSNVVYARAIIDEVGQ